MKAICRIYSFDKKQGDVSEHCTNFLLFTFGLPMAVSGCQFQHASKHDLFTHCSPTAFKIYTKIHSDQINALMEWLHFPIQETLPIHEILLQKSLVLELENFGIALSSVILPEECNFTLTMMNHAKVYF